MITKKDKRLEATNAAVGQAEIALLADDTVALDKLALFTPDEMRSGIAAIIEDRYRDDGTQDELVWAKIMIVKMVATLNALDGLTYSMEGRETMELLRSRVLGS